MTARPFYDREKTVTRRLGWLDTKPGEIRGRRMPGNFVFHGGFAMLILSRKVGEAVLIGDLITVQVVVVRGNTVRLGIEAPQEYGIVRTELIEIEWPEGQSNFDFANSAE